MGQRPTQKAGRCTRGDFNGNKILGGIPKITPGNLRYQGYQGHLDTRIPRILRML